MSNEASVPTLRGAEVAAGSGPYGPTTRWVHGYENTIVTGVSDVTGLIPFLTNAEWDATPSNGDFYSLHTDQATGMQVAFTGTYIAGTTSFLNNPQASSEYLTIRKRTNGANSETSWVIEIITLPTPIVTSRGAPYVIDKVRWVVASLNGPDGSLLNVTPLPTSFSVAVRGGVDPNFINNGTNAQAMSLTLDIPSGGIVVGNNWTMEVHTPTGFPEDLAMQTTFRYHRPVDVELLIADDSFVQALDVDGNAIAVGSITYTP